MLPKKHLLGARKRKRKKLADQFVESQRGGIHKFFSASSSVAPIDNPVDALDIEEQGQQQVNDNLTEQVDANDDAIENENLQPFSQPENSNDDVQEASMHDVFDPRTWENLDNKGREILIEKGPVRELNLEFPVDALNRHFSYAYYSRKLSNGEVVDRKWLVTLNMWTKFFVFAINCSNLVRANVC